MGAEIWTQTHQKPQRCGQLHPATKRHPRLDVDLATRHLCLQSKEMWRGAHRLRIAQDGATNPDGDEHDELRVAWNDDLIKKIYKNHESVHESVHESGCFKVALLASFIGFPWVPYHWFPPLTT